MDGFDDMFKEFIGHKSSKHTHLGSIRFYLGSLSEQGYTEDELEPLYDITERLGRINIQMTEEEFSQLHSNLYIFSHLDLRSSYAQAVLKEIAQSKNLIENSIRFHRTIFRELIEQADDYLEELADNQEDKESLKAIYTIKSHYAVLEHLLNGIDIREKAVVKEIEKVLLISKQES